MVMVKQLHYLRLGLPEGDFEMFFLYPRHLYHLHKCNQLHTSCSRGAMHHASKCWSLKLEDFQR